MNTITDLLDLEDSDVFVSGMEVDGTQKRITLKHIPSRI